MSLIKNILKSIAILFGVAILVVFLGIAIMMLFKVEIFGYKWLQDKFAPQPTITEINNASKIYIETNGIPVEIRSSTDANTIEFKFNAKFQGLAKTESIVDEKTPFNFTAGFNSGVYEIKTQEPSGLFFNNSSKLTVWLPNTMNITDLSIKTGTNKINFDGLNIEVDNFTMEANTDLKEYTIGENLTVNKNFNLKTSSGRINVNADINGNVVLDSHLSTFIFKNSIGNGSNSYLSIQGDNPCVEFGDINNPNSNVNISSDVTIECPKGGLIKISGIVFGTITIIDSPLLVMNVETTYKEITATDGFKQLYIKNLNGNATIEKKDGYLKINNSKADNLVVIGNKNAVEIENLYGNAEITNEYGEVNINCSDLALNTRTLTITTKNSAINVTNIHCNTVLTSEKGVINAQFAKVVNSCSITTNESVNVKVVDNLNFNLTTKTKTGGVNVSLGSANYDNWDAAETVEGYKVITTAVNSGSSANTLTIQTNSGKIEVGISY